MTKEESSTWIKPVPKKKQRPASKKKVKVLEVVKVTQRPNNLNGTKKMMMKKQMTFLSQWVRQEAREDRKAMKTIKIQSQGNNAQSKRKLMRSLRHQIQILEINLIFMEKKIRD
ncbi:hypothetical protein COB52_05685 [Candidatus Kaiserbacteria bacterium]|nr:MAG: hypothetical protein COB52_05685 [Candidatus Kaiserbacteria bacterium]